jgi:hypothetical protein
MARPMTKSLSLFTIAAVVTDAAAKCPIMGESLGLYTITGNCFCFVDHSSQPCRLEGQSVVSLPWNFRSWSVCVSSLLLALHQESQFCDMLACLGAPCATMHLQILLLEQMHSIVFQTPHNSCVCHQRLVLSTFHHGHSCFKYGYLVSDNYSSRVLFDSTLKCIRGLLVV